MTPAPGQTSIFDQMTAIDAIEVGIKGLPVVGENAGWDHLRRKDVLRVVESIRDRYVPQVEVKPVAAALAAAHETLSDDMTLGEARAWLRDRVEHGEHCPTCTQFTKVYRRTITSSSARSLITMFRSGAVGEYVHLPTILGRKQADEAKMTYWGLIEEAGEARPDGGRAGWWRLTPLGDRWVHGRASVLRYARVFDGRCLGLEGPATTIQDALGRHFNLHDLMAGL